MRILTLREREAIGIGKALPHSKPGVAIAESEVAAFERLQARLPLGALSWEHRSIRFGPFCGVIRAGDVVVELLPKIEEFDEPIPTARGLLVSMLRSTGAVNLTALGEAALGQQKMHLLDIFILDFCIRVSDALRQGAIACYEMHTENLNALRGRIRLTEHLRLNAFDRSRVYCDFDERTIDNPYNRVLRAVLSSLLPETLSAHVRARVAALLHRLDGVRSVVVTSSDIERLGFDRMTQRWKPVFERAKWLLQGLFPDLRAGGTSGVCLVFNMERLFEAFIGVKLRREWQVASPTHYEVHLQGPQQAFAVSDTGEGVFALKPDVTVLSGGCVVRIFDTKWKRLDSSQRNLGISPTDAYQLAAYASRYRCNRVALIYPASQKCPAGLVGNFTLEVPNAPLLQVHAVDLPALASGSPLSNDLRPTILGDIQAAA